MSEKIAPKEILLNIEVQTTSALLSWKLECGDMTTPISGYIVHYCKSLGNTNNCTSPTLNYTVKGDRTTGNYKLDNLEKDAYYRTWISTMPLIKGGREQRSAISPVYVPSRTLIQTRLLLLLSIIFRWSLTVILVNPFGNNFSNHNRNFFKKVSTNYNST